MGSGASTKALRENLKVSSEELAQERRRIEEKDAQLASVQECLRQQLDGGREESLQNTRREMSICELRSELRAGETEYATDVQRLRTELMERHHSELRTVRQEHDAALHETIERRAKQASDDAQMQRETLEQSHQSLVVHLREAAEAVSDRHREEIERSETTITRLRDDVTAAQGERGQVEEALRETRELLHAAQLQQAHASASSSDRASNLERRCSEVQLEHVEAAASIADRAGSAERRLAEVQHDRARIENRCLDVEQRFSQLEEHHHAQERELQAELRERTEEVHRRGDELRQRERDLVEVSGQLDELQILFDEVTSQLHVECGRVGAMQERVAACAKQSVELEQLRSMLDDSHAMLAQLREALEHERCDRIRTGGLLEHEQKRTKVLLDVLRSFKEKLQGLTPQMLLNRVGSSDLKELAALVGNNGVQPPDVKSHLPRKAVSSSAVSPCPPPAAINISMLPPCPQAPGLRAASPYATVASGGNNNGVSSPSHLPANAAATTTESSDSTREKEEEHEQASDSTKFADLGGQVESHYIGSPGSTTARSPSPRHEFVSALA